ncbi:sugar ABC transporter substrate-binding protein [Enterocloster clostridioformis]|uniref:cyclodeaminase/cyclohydrolase family protein n=1 Tax=Enterocloster clostridioformis TaxID=1531 RepID=UPI00080CA405|nr:cyclodeaminase/cyclohydrolase family protein [Enterocloster clostridioformis]ANU46096.1 sugar ABC transporter substrate-binding protein [Lachnoclostridium sp. YL32]NDO30040.1 cyclodeaminase/cyclohydrolase family protein [Enterocloster clostridioformis]OXE67408.1 sugar ABC transporter substrate-binding protein [Enterocloster clostridioformis]QQQ99156.1 cyclodeaminase/cyclohydrolase family protein [Enterocloster clostridioformis]
MIESMTIQEFLDVLSSKEPVPGGGGASALAGALGNALGQMVSNLTIGKKKYALVEDEIKELAERMKGIQGQFTQLADQDAKVFAPLAKCYSLPSDTEEEKAYKAEVMEARLLDASLVPMEIMEKAAEMLEIMDILADKGSRMAVSDVGVGVQFIRTALLGAVMNVYINTKSMKNREKAEEMNEKAERLIREGTEAADRIYQKVLGQLR